MKTKNGEMRLGERLRSLRKSLGLTQVELEAAAGLPSTLVSQVEKEHRVPGARTLLKLADALGVSVDELLRDPEKISRGA